VRKTVSVLFCDLVGSTALGERLDPEALRAVLDRYFAVVRAQIEAHGGIVEKYVGDAVMAVFGIPVLHEDDALRAVRAAAAIPATVSELNDRLGPRSGVRLQVRVGISTGSVVTGAGAGPGGQRLATGDAVNLASRLQGLAEPGGIVMAEATHRLVRDAVRADRLDPVTVKGKSESMRPWRLRAVDATAGRRVRTDAPLVGRDGELAGLADAFAGAVADGAPRRRVVVGAAGVGKSRVIAEFLTRLPPGTTVLRGRCLSYGQGISFWPVREMLAPVAGWTGNETAVAAVAKLADLLPGRADAQEIAERVGQLLGLGAATAGLQETFWALTTLLDELAGWAPVVVVADDLHWAEPTYLDLLDHLSTAATGPVLLLGGTRPDVFEQRPDWAADERIVLDALDTEGSARLLAGLLAPGDPPPQVIEHVLAAAEGNPLFVEQLVATLVDDGTLARDAGGAWMINRHLEPGLLPDTIGSLLAARLEHLDQAEQLALGAGAVVGRVFWRGAVAELAREAVGPDAGRHLNALVGRQLIVPEPSSFADEDAYKFRHVLLRDAAYVAMPKAERATAHQSFARWLERTAGGRAEEYDEILGYHLEQAVQLRTDIGLIDDSDALLAAEAGRRLWTGAERAVNRGDFGTAIPLLERAERLLSGNGPAHADVLVELSRALRNSGATSDASAWLTAALRESRSTGDRVREERARIVEIDLASATDVSWSPADALRSLEASVAVLGEAGDDVGLADAWFLIGRVHGDAGRHSEAEPALERAVEHAVRCGRSAAAAMPRIWLAMNLVYGPTPATTAAVRLDRIAAEAKGNQDVEAELLGSSAVVAAMEGRFPAAWQLLDASRRVFDDLGIVAAPTISALKAFEIARRQQRLDAAEPALREADRACAELGDPAVHSTISAMLAHLLWTRGQLDEAQSYAELARSMTQQDDLWSQVLWRTALAKVRSSRGAHGEAAELATEAVRACGRSDWLCLHGDALLDLAEVLRRAGRDAEARAATSRALALYERKGDRASMVVARSFLTARTAATS
jgi:class 3 adenylate cyclase/tetratricopeptide (TPR) repeat protein